MLLASLGSETNLHYCGRYLRWHPRWKISGQALPVIQWKTVTRNSFPRFPLFWEDSTPIVWGYKIILCRNSYIYIYIYIYTIYARVSQVVFVPSGFATRFKYHHFDRLKLRRIVVPSKCRVLFTSIHGIKTQNTWVFSTAIKVCNIANDVQYAFLISRRPLPSPSWFDKSAASLTETARAVALNFVISSKTSCQFYVYGSVHRWSILIIVQRDATQSSLFFYKFTLLVSGVSHTHHQEYAKL